MGIGGRIDDNSIGPSIGLLNPVHQNTFVVGLANIHGNAHGFGLIFDHADQILIGSAAVDFRLPDTQHIEIGAVENENVHRFLRYTVSFRRIWVITSPMVPSLSTVTSAKRA